MRSLALFLLSLAALANVAYAQDIPGRVGRLAWVDGNVALYQDPELGWEDGYVNSPITSRNSVWTEPGARAELQVAAIAVRLDEDTQLDVSRLDDTTLEATLDQGSGAIRIRYLRPGETVRLSTPQATFLLQSEGRYRLDADPERAESRLSVFDGDASLETSRGTVRIDAGQSMVVWGEDPPSYALQEAYITDFDRWAMARDERWTDRHAPRYVSYEMTGYEDLDAYGEWSQDPTYGAIWFPTRVASDWAPYRDGRWTYVEPWGWTWVDAQPWGYAPFHYGRWVHLRDRWAWCPGRRVDQPVWAPALVGFIGGSGWSATVSSGAPVVGWYPLAPSEPYRPWYRATSKYVQRVNVTVVNVPQNLAREHRQWNRDRAATVVRREALVQQRPVAQARVSVPASALQRAPAIAAPVTALPSRNDVRQAARQEAPRQGTRAPGPQASERHDWRNRGASAPAAKPNAIARPSFAAPHAAPKPAAAGATPPPPTSAPGARRAPPASARGDERNRERPAQRGGESAPRAAPTTPAQPLARPQEANRPAPPAQPAHPEANQAVPRAPGNRQPEEGRGGARERQAQPPAAQQERAAQQQRAAEEQRAAAQKASQEAQQRAAESQRAAQEAKQRSEHEAQQRASQQRDEAQRAAQQRQEAQHAAQQREESQRAAQQREETQRAAQQREETQRAAQQRAAQEAQQRSAQEAKQHAAQEAQQRAAQQKAAQEAQQRAGQQRAAQEAQHAAQQKAAEEAQRRGAQEAQRRAPEAKGGGRGGPPEERGKEKGRGENDNGDKKGQ